ncbi:potassium channel family protein, partial [Candidatus Woesearchaeota archaeon]|nr:potassium channel family protein [Candidatus Woesearchaeota archaeon]
SKPHFRVSFRTKVLLAVFTVLVLIIVGTVVYRVLEGWGFVDSAYFTMITLTTIGYGDLVPTTAASKMFTAFFAFAGVAVFLFALSILADYYFGQRAQSLEKQVKRVSDKAMRMMGKEDIKPPSRRAYVKSLRIDRHGKWQKGERKR